MNGLGLILPPGGAQLNIVEPVACPGQSANGQQGGTAQDCYLVLVRVAKPVAVTKLSIYTSATGGNFDLAILDSSYAKLVGLSAPVASVANGLTTGILSAAFTYAPGVDYYHALVGDVSSGTVSVRGVAVTGAVINAGSVNRALAKSVGQNRIPNPVVSPTSWVAVYWIAGHN